ncbi:protein belonging to Uncharacterized protein family UPF0147 [mine drainage metagenome]|uniref:Protein belonging to Uncharacterized protein family UPF0147 n=1 Tax=mine drainage metagenome TaxID=410659 RepID=T1BCF4_9ZZZZ
MIPDPPGSEAALPAAPTAEPSDRSAALERALEALSQLADDPSVPRNIRRGAQTAHDRVARSRAELDVRIAGAVSALDELANAPNLPSHGRTALWSILSSLESLP